MERDDYLGYIAERYLGDFDRYRELARLNKLRNPDRILPGQVVRLPIEARDTGPQRHATGAEQPSTAGSAPPTAPSGGAGDAAGRPALPPGPEVAPQPAGTAKPAGPASTAPRPTGPTATSAPQPTGAPQSPKVVPSGPLPAEPSPSVVPSGSLPGEPSAVRPPSPTAQQSAPSGPFDPDVFAPSQPAVAAAAARTGGQGAADVGPHRAERGLLAVALAAVVTVASVLGAQLAVLLRLRRRPAPAGDAAAAGAELDATDREIEGRHRHR